MRPGGSHGLKVTNIDAGLLQKVLMLHANARILPMVGWCTLNQTLMYASLRPFLVKVHNGERSTIPVLQQSGATSASLMITLLKMAVAEALGIDLCGLCLLLSIFIQRKA